ncbi:MAG: XdhC family protein [Anaerolineaceae bacterium]|nr:XdhC family protein [Anaerolineaceae bacterium]
MREIYPQIQSWLNKGQQIVIASVVSVYGSAPRPLGSKMAICQDGQFTGSVSGGCIEAAVISEAQNLYKSGESKLLKYGISDESAWEHGLACGGEIEVFLESLSYKEEDRSLLADILDSLHLEIRRNNLFGVITILSGEAKGNKQIIWPDGRTDGDLGNVDIESELIRSMSELFTKQQSKRISVDTETGTVDVFIDILQPPPKLIIIGAVHIAVPLVSLANTLGFRTIVLDARSAFATKERFPHADQLISAWPAEKLISLDIDESTYIVFLSHDEKIDNPALKVALSSPARYIGALGSRKTHSNRKNALLELGVLEDQLTRIYAPIGLNIGATGAEEIALSIMAEIIAVHHGMRENDEE